MHVYFPLHIIIMLSICFLLPVHAAVIDAYPNTAMVEQGTTLVLVCRVVGVPSTTVLSYQWTCPGGSCDAGAVDPEWAAKVQQGNILVVNVRNGNDTGDYTCTVMDSSTQLASVTHSVTVTSELCIVPWAMSRENLVCGCMYLMTLNLAHFNCILPRRKALFQI